MIKETTSSAGISKAQIKDSSEESYSEMKDYRHSDVDR